MFLPWQCSHSFTKLPSYKKHVYKKVFFKSYKNHLVWLNLHVRGRGGAYFVGLKALLQKAWLVMVKAGLVEDLVPRLRWHSKISNLFFNLIFKHWMIHEVILSYWHVTNAIKQTRNPVDRLTDWQSDGLMNWWTDGLTGWRTDDLADWRTDGLMYWRTGLTWQTDKKGLADSPMDGRGANI